nr:16S rRNA (guanine(966)-N(2))-methyltransferase RsmD [Caldalkalibacillus uzonensis]
MLVRVISGALKGRRLAPVPGQQTRPTTDRVKEAIFNLIPVDMYRDGTGLDLFAGTGSLGIEALSRGCRRMVFIDHHPLAIKVIYQNLKALGLTGQSEVYKNDARRALKVLAKRGIEFNVIFLDPPYAHHNLPNILSLIEQYDLLRPEGVIVVETAKGTDLKDKLDRLILDKHHHYGDTEIRIYARREASS